VFVYTGGKMQVQECMPTRGFQSAVDYRLTFGLGAFEKVDSLAVVWNDGTVERMKNVRAGQRIVADQQNAGGAFDFSVFHKANPFFAKATDELGIAYRHKENSFVEFNREALIPHMMSAEGPGAAVADINGDGREDLFAGGAKWKAGHIYLQTAQGKFRELVQPEIARDSVHEDTAAEFFDADGDGDQDLVVVSGGNEFSRKSPNRQPRLYLNDSKGNFTRSAGMAEVYLTGACVSVADIDGDGDQDMFLGARAIPWQYGIRPDSYLLLNDGKGNFTDATKTVAPALEQFGFVKHAIWADINNDNAQDLVIAAEWSAITIFINSKGRLTPLATEGSGLEKSNGWWNVIKAFDFDNDGDLDLVAGNLGLNSKLKTSPEAPVRLYAADLDKNDSIDQILSHYINGKEYAFHTRDEMTKQMPSLKKKYLSYSKFAGATLHDMFTSEQLAGAAQYVACTFQSSLIENLGNGKFSVRPLPKAAQISTVNAILTDDFDGDGKTDILLAGNFYPINIQMGRNDASYGLFMKGDGRGNFSGVPAVQSGFSVTGEVRSLRKIVAGGRPCYLAIRNNNTIEAFRLKQ
jgi:enediyne biosynthesis protein E4